MSLRRLTIVLGLLLGAIVPAAAAEVAAEVTDLAGRTVRVPARGERIVLGEGRFLAALGILDRADREGCIALIAIHDINLALRFCDRVVVLNKGRLLSTGTPDEALDSDLLRRAYGVEGRVEACSRGFRIVLADRALNDGEGRE